MVEGGDVSGARVTGAPIERVVRVAAVVVLDALEDPDAFGDRELEHVVPRQRPSPGHSGHRPGALRGHPLVENRVAQVRLRVEHARALERLALGVRHAVPEGQDQLGQRVTAGCPVDHVVRAVVRIVPARPEGVARRLALTLQLVDQPLPLLPRQVEHRVAVGLGSCAWPARRR